MRNVSKKRGETWSGLIWVIQKGWRCVCFVEAGWSFAVSHFLEHTIIIHKRVRVFPEIRGSKQCSTLPGLLTLFVCVHPKNNGNLLRGLSRTMAGSLDLGQSDSVFYLQNIFSLNASCPGLHKMLDSELPITVFPLPHRMPNGNSRLPLSGFLIIFRPHHSSHLISQCLAAESPY